MLNDKIFFAIYQTWTTNKLLNFLTIVHIVIQNGNNGNTSWKFNSKALKNS